MNSRHLAFDKITADNGRVYLTAFVAGGNADTVEVGRILSDLTDSQTVQDFIALMRIRALMLELSEVAARAW